MVDKDLKTPGSGDSEPKGLKTISKVLEFYYNLNGDLDAVIKEETWESLRLMLRQLNSHIISDISRLERIKDYMTKNKNKITNYF